MKAPLALMSGALVAFLVFTVAYFCACAASETAQYAEEQSACEIQAKTRLEAQACRASSKARWDCRWAAEYPDAGIWTCAEGGATP